MYMCNIFFVEFHLRVHCIRLKLADESAIAWDGSLGN